MTSNFFQFRSIKSRVTLFTLIIFVISIWLLSQLASHKLYQDMAHQLGDQQLTTTSLLATHINNDLQGQLNDLNKIAGKITPDILNNPSALQELLENNILIERDFNAGAFITRLDGTAIASVPTSVQRIGVNYMERDHITSALNLGKPKISELTIGKVLKTPVFAMAVPIRDAQGKVIGAVAGVIDLNMPNFLDDITNTRYGKSGYYLLVEQKSRLIITGTDKRNIMQPLPAIGVNETIDRQILGYEEVGITLNSAGQEILTSASHLGVAGWIMIAAIPTAEAFAPVNNLKDYIFYITILMTLVAAGLTWWMLTRELSPMFDTVKKLTELADSDQTPALLPIKKHNEIGELISAFNHLLTISNKREDALRKSKAQLRTLLQTIPDPIWLKDTNGVYLSCNSMFERLYGAKEADIVGKTDYDFVDKTLADFFREHDRKAMMANKALSNEEWLTFAHDGYHGLFETVKTPLTDNEGKLVGVLGVAHDITERKAVENKLRMLSTAIEQNPASVAISNLAAELEYVNPRFTEVTGYSLSEAIGKNPRVLQSGLTEPSVYRDLWKKLTNGQTWVGEFVNKRKNGDIYYEEAYISPVKDNNGTISHYVAVKLDITDRKQMEKQIRQLALHDPLTNLPNRRLLIDRMNQAKVTSKRNQRYCALMFIDLDNFKPLNDTQGHEAGDLLLIEVSKRLQKCVREMDTVARIGGDEFVVMLTKLNTDKLLSTSQAEKVAEKIRTALSDPYLVELTDEAGNTLKVEHHCTASIGVVMFISDETSQIDILRYADEAMYQAKTAGRNQVRFHNT